MERTESSDEAINAEIDALGDAIFYVDVYAVTTDVGTPDGDWSCVQLVMVKDGQIEVVAERRGKTLEEAARAFAPPVGTWSMTAPTKTGLYWWRESPTSEAGVVFVLVIFGDASAVFPGVTGSKHVSAMRGQWYSIMVEAPR